MVGVTLRVTALLACGVVAAACHAMTKPAPPDQSQLFFPAAVDTYGLDLAQDDQEHLAELHALRQIDPCGFVDRDTLIANDHKDFSYTYTAARQVETGGFGPIAPLGGDGCVIAFPASKEGIELRILPGCDEANHADVHLPHGDSNARGCTRVDG